MSETAIRNAGFVISRARGSAVIKVMKVVPRPGHFVSNYVDVYKMPAKAKPARVGKPPPLALQEMPHLDVKEAVFSIDTKAAKIPGPPAQLSLSPEAKANICNPKEEEFDPSKGLPDGHRMLKWFGYREWAKAVFPCEDGNIADHFNGLLGLLMSMTVDPDNANFPDVEAYPCIQFLRTVKTSNGEIPNNIANFIEYIEYICWKIIEES